MINRYFIGFVLVAGVTVAGVDYVEQSKKADLPLGQMPLAAYAETVPQRIEAYKAEKSAVRTERERQAAWRQGGLQYLPEAPEGWTRRALLEGDDSAIMPPFDSQNSDGAGQTLLQHLEAREEVKRYRQRAKRSYVYQRGTETIFVEIKLKEKPASHSFIELAASLGGAGNSSGPRMIGYDTIGGVGFVEELLWNGGREHHYRILRGRVGFGEEVVIGVHANAGSAATEKILAAINYDGLNSMLTHPVQMVGNAVKLPAGLDGQDVSLALHDLYRKFVSLRGREAKYRIGNAETQALLLNTYADSLGDKAALRDMTGGEKLSLSALIDYAYHMASVAVRSGASPAKVTAHATRMVDAVATLADAEATVMVNLGEEATAPAMSPELAAELGFAIPEPDLTGYAAAEAAKEDGDDKDSAVNLIIDIDARATDATWGNVISKTFDPQRYEAVKTRLGATEAEMQLALVVMARSFEARHNLPAESCDFIAERYRLECDSAPIKTSGDLVGMVSNVIGTQVKTPKSVQTNDSPKRLQLSGGGGSSGGRCVGSFCD